MGSAGNVQNTLGMVTFILRFRLTMWRRSLRSNRGIRRLGPVVGSIFYVFIAALIALFSAAVTSSVASQDPGREADLLLVPFAAMFLTTLVSGIGVAVNELFVSSDVELLLTAPLTDRTLYLLKLIDCSLPVWPAAGWVLSSLIGFGVALGLGLGYYLGAIAVVLLVAVALTAFAVGVVLLLARLVPPRRLREAMLLISALLGVGVWLLWAGGGSRRAFNRGTIQRVSSIDARLRWTPLGWATSAAGGASSGDWAQFTGYMLLLVALLVVLVVIGYLLFAHVFLAGWSAAREAGPRRRRRRERGAAEGSNSVVVAMAIKDWLTLRRDLPYLTAQLPSLLYAVIYPFILIRVPTGHTVAGRWLSIAGLPVVPLLAASGFGLTAISREGKAFDVLRGAPAGAGPLLAGKMLAVGVPIGLISTVAGIALALFRGAPASAVSVAVLGGLWLGAGCSVVAVAVGAYNPRFDLEFSRRRQNPNSAGCLLYLAIATLFAAGSALLVAAVVADVLGRLGALAVPSLIVSALLFASGLCAAAIAVGFAVARLGALLAPES